MEDQIKTWLLDIHQAILEINQFLPEKKKFKEFEGDIKTRRAVERNLEIIGEAINRIIKSDGNLIITNSRKIVDTRNRIIHGYDNVSSEIIWSIILRDLPELEQEINQLLKKL
jgi:uncharacterized protein with HEPN domain